MNYRSFGNSSLQVSEIGFGAWAIGGGWGPQSEQDSIQALETAVTQGVNFIDTAASYGAGKSEQIIGRWIKNQSSPITVATKIPPRLGTWPPTPWCSVDDRFPESYLEESLNERLRNLNTDSIDLLQLHTWTRAWNRSPKPFELLQRWKAQGKIKHIGVSTPEHDQHAVLSLIKEGLVDSVQVIYNIFDQEAAAELLPVAQEYGVGVIVRVALDEGSLSGKFTPQTTFADDDFRNRYFQGDRLQRTVKRVNAIKSTIEGWDKTMVEVALQFVLAHEAVSTVIVGMRNQTQALQNTAVSDLPPLSANQISALRSHHWNRAMWYVGK